MKTLENIRGFVMFSWSIEKKHWWKYYKSFKQSKLIGTIHRADAIMLHQLKIKSFIIDSTTPLF